MFVSPGLLVFQSDMYSLGVILFEMCQLFKTDMERLKTIEKLRHGLVPQSFRLHWSHQVSNFAFVNMPFS